jgi:hypothetical protein
MCGVRTPLRRCVRGRASNQPHGRVPMARRAHGLEGRGLGARLQKHGGHACGRTEGARRAHGGRMEGARRAHGGRACGRMEGALAGAWKARLWARLQAHGRRAQGRGGGCACGRGALAGAASAFADADSALARVNGALAGIGSTLASARRGVCGRRDSGWRKHRRRAGGRTENTCGRTEEANGRAGTRRAGEWNRDSVYGSRGEVQGARAAAGVGQAGAAVGDRATRTGAGRELGERREGRPFAICRRCVRQHLWRMWSRDFGFRKAFEPASSQVTTRTQGLKLEARC